MFAEKKPLLSIDDYLAGEEASDVLHDYINGEVYAMPGASAEHNILSTSLLSALHHHLAGKPCRVFSSGLKLYVRMAGQDIFYYPDLMVACDPSDNHRHYRERPRVLVEILSASTLRVDTREKLATYLTLPSLEEYVLIAQETMEVTIRERSHDWQPRRLNSPEDLLTLPSLGFEMSLATLYADIEWPTALPPNVTSTRFRESPPAMA